MKTLFNSAAATLETVKRSIYFLELMAVVIAIPLLTYLQISHKDNPATSSNSVIKTDISQNQATGIFSHADKNANL